MIAIWTRSARHLDDMAARYAAREREREREGGGGGGKGYTDPDVNGD